MSTKIVSLSGESETGKDTFAAPLIKRGWKYASFAEPLKEMCKQLFGIADYFVNDPTGKKSMFVRPRILTPKIYAQIIGYMEKSYHLEDMQDIISKVRQECVDKPFKNTGKYLEFSSPRKLLQFVGTDICREVFPEYFLDMLKKELDRDVRNAVITDSRFPNEREMLKNEFGATLIRIKRPGYTLDSEMNNRPQVEGSVVHVSESSLGADSEYDIIILNNGNIDELQTRALTLL